MNRPTGKIALSLVLLATVAPCGPALAEERPQAAADQDRRVYVMTPAEMAYDCRRLTGHLQVRIRQYRSTRQDTKTSELARSLQKTVTPVIGGTQRGLDPDTDNARDLSKIRVYNGRLLALNCATFDLDRLLAPGNTEDPRPTPKPKPGKTPIAAPPPTAKAK